MLARRIIAISPDKAFAKTIGVALKAAGGAVEAHATLDALTRGEVDASLVVIHVMPETAGALSELLPRLTGDTRLVVILSKAHLAFTVDLMQASDRVTAVMVAEELEMNDLSAVATRVLAGDIFGLEKAVPWGTKIHSTLVGDYQEKSLAIAQLSEFAEAMSVRRKYREAVEQCVDEMLMNALYDAPVDEQGRPIFSEIPTKTRISLRVEQKVVVQYACDGHKFSVSVRDAFGSLERSTVLRYLHKCLHSEQQIDRKTGGAGLGLYLIASSASRINFNVLPGVATEVVCTFDLDSPKIQLETFGFFNEKIDAGGRLAAGPSRLLPAGASHPVDRREPPRQSSKLLVAALAIAVLATLGLIAALAIPRLFGDKKTTVQFTSQPEGATLEIEGRPRGTTPIAVDGLIVGRAVPVLAKLEGYEDAQTVVQPTESPSSVSLTLKPKQATVVLESDPAGATVVVDGRELGVTPLTVTSFEPKRAISVSFRKVGYIEATQTIDVPGPGKDTKLRQPLSVSQDFATVILQSDPPGAQIYKDGQLLPGEVTPSGEILVEAGKKTRFGLALNGYITETVEAAPERGSRRLVLPKQLTPGLPISVKSNVEGKATVAGVDGCKGLDVANFECVVRPGDYTVTFSGRMGASASRRVVVKDGPGTATFEFGFVEATGGRKLQVDGGEATRGAFEPGPRTIILFDANGNITPRKVTVKAGQTVSVP